MPSNPSPVHDSATKWTSAPDWTDAVIERANWTARPVLGLSQVLVSGDVGAALRAHAPDAAVVGLWEPAITEPVAARIARDRVLLIAPAPLEIPFGWNGGWAASPASDAWFVVDLEGPAVEEVVREGTAADLGASSPSAAILFAGIQAVLYRRGDHNVRLHVEMPFGSYLWRWLETRAG